MLTMTDINTIKNLRNNHDKSINDIAQTLRINWRTAKKYADQPVWPKPIKQIKRGMMYDEEWGDIVSLWLEEDFRLPKKKRRTALNYFEALCDLNFSGSYRTVTNYVREWKSNHHQELPTAGYERLEHPPGEAQLDFGTMEVEHQGVFKDVKALVLSFPFSNAGFAVALPSENQECLLTGMTQLFDQIGGVPRKIRIDNMVTAVAQPKTKFEPAVLSEGFQLFTLHYGFEVQVCNPASGHEKGSVENKVGYVRYNFFSDSPRMTSYHALNQELEETLRDKRQAIHYEKGVRIEALWQTEQQSCLALPDETYPVFKEVELQANKLNEITLDQTRIHVLNARRHPRLVGHLTWNRYRILTPQGELLAEDYRPYMNKQRVIPWGDILKDWKQRLAKIPYSRYWKYLPGRLQAYLGIDDLRLLYQRIDQLIHLLVHHSLIEINENFYELLGQEMQESISDVNWLAYDALTLPSSQEVTS